MCFMYITQFGSLKGNSSKPANMLKSFQCDSEKAFLTGPDALD